MDVHIILPPDLVQLNNSCLIEETVEASITGNQHHPHRHCLPGCNSS